MDAQVLSQETVREKVPGVDAAQEKKRVESEAVDVLGHLRSDKLVHVYIYKDGEVVSVSRHENSKNNIKIQSSVSEDDQQSDTVLPELE